MHKTEYNELHVDWISIFVSKWRLELETSLIGRSSLLDVFFEDIGSIIYHMLTQCLECDNNVIYSVDIKSKYITSKLPTTFLLTGNEGTGKRYFINEVFSSFLKTIYKSGESPRFSTTFNIPLYGYLDDGSTLSENLHKLNIQLMLISELGGRLKRLLHEGFVFPPLILVYFGSENETRYSAGSRCHSNFKRDRLIIYNLISRYTSSWYYEDVPIVSFFTSERGSYMFNMYSSFELNSINMKHHLKHGYKLFFEIDLNRPLFRVDKISLLKFLIYKRYCINESALDYLIMKISDLHSVYIEQLSNQELNYVINDIDLFRINDILYCDEIGEIRYIASSANFVAVVPSGVEPDFFSVFLHYLQSVLLKFGNLIDTGSQLNAPNCEYYSAKESEFDGIIGCSDIVSKIKKHLIPCIMKKSEPKTSEPPIIFDNALGIIIFGDKGCGKSFFANSISKYLNCSAHWISSADVFNSTIGFLEKYLKKLVNICGSKRRYVLVFEDIDQYLMNNNTMYSFMFIFDLLSRYNKWFGCEIMIFGTSKRHFSVSNDIFQPYRFFMHISLPGHGEWSLKDISDILNIHLRPMLTRFSNKMSVETNPDRIDQLMNSIALLIERSFTPSAAVGISNESGLFLLRLMLQFSNDKTIKSQQDYLDNIYTAILSIASRYCAL
ncbi:putative transmembrane domain-containing protein [Cryptosporidium canis]|uniref:Transmembrane domain-containing protein n=1 Tax=Cryptosporidium canis TaxID=195482 RepID=A0ABQ8P4H5_9CRYT|nr:putative transmembrane domain-containing protein [Cryptosporidium canis]